MPLRRARSFGGSRPQRRKSSWELGPGGSTLLSLVATTNGVLVGSFAQLVRDGHTLVRIRGAFRGFTVAGGALGSFIGAFGIGIATEQAMAVGAGALDMPFDEQAGEDWLFWRPIQFFLPAIGDEGVNGTVVEFEVDTKAMRKLSAGDAIYAAIAGVETNTINLEIAFDSRALFLLP